MIPRTPKTPPNESQAVSAFLRSKGDRAFSIEAKKKGSTKYQSLLPSCSKCTVGTCPANVIGASFEMIKLSKQITVKARDKMANTPLLELNLMVSTKCLGLQPE